MTAKVSTVLCEQGKTRIVPYEDRLVPLKIEIFEERFTGKEYLHRRQFLAVVVLGEDTVQVTSSSIRGLAFRLGLVLLALTESQE